MKTFDRHTYSDPRIIMPCMNNQLIECQITARLWRFISFRDTYALLWQCNGCSSHQHRINEVRRLINESLLLALKEVSVALLAGFFPFPNFNFAFCDSEDGILVQFRIFDKRATLKSDACSFFFFELFVIPSATGTSQIVAHSIEWGQYGVSRETTLIVQQY